MSVRMEKKTDRIFEFAMVYVNLKYLAIIINLLR